MTYESFTLSGLNFISTLSFPLKSLIFSIQKLAYIRISSTFQNLDRQRELIVSFKPDKVFEDIITGKTKQRPALGELIIYCRAGDLVLVPSIDRLGRSLIDLNEILTEITKKGVSVYFVKENLEFSGDKADPMKTLMFNLLSCFAQFEREIIKDRQAEGIAIAKKQGKFKGGKKDTEKREKILALYKQGVSRKKIAELHRVASYPTVSKVIREYEENLLKK
jgi:DNA invertase Pin-like site-specific DNA recombinase